MYLYVAHEVGLCKVPDDLLTQFGEPQFTLSFDLTEERPLAKEDPRQVLANLEEHGYHIQLPPVITPV